MTTPLLERYRRQLEIDEAMPVVSLGEGSTPLLHAPRISARLGVELYLKWEGANPTGSFKDRGMTVAVSRALAQGAKAIVCASTGNTAASAAAYAARAGISAFVLHPVGGVTLGKLAQACALGARVLAVRGTFEDALGVARELAGREGHVLVNSLNHDRIKGQKTAAFEIVEELGDRPDVVALPYGGGGNLVAHAEGFEQAGKGLPRLIAAEAAERAYTLASAIQIAEPAHAAEVETAVVSSGGCLVSLSDEEMLKAWSELAHREGIFCELAAAAGLAAVEHVRVARGERVVCVITGHGLKDPETATQLAPGPITVEADADAILAATSFSGSAQPR